MKCSKCQKEAPGNVLSLGKSPAWVCANCNSIHLKDELTSLYSSSVPGRYLYVSELTNNLNKIRQYFLENLDLSNSTCSIILCTPESLRKISGSFDKVYCDKECLHIRDLESIKLTMSGTIILVDPTTQMI